MQKRLTRMTFLTSIFALMLITLYSPISQITVSVFTITFMHIFVLIGIYIFDDWKESLALGAFFGIISMMYAYQFPVITRIPFQNPLVSIVPRILFSMTAYGLLQLFKRFDKRVLIAVWAGFSTILHTFFVVTAVSIFLEPRPLAVIQSIIVFNMLPELLLAAFVVSFVAVEVKKYIQKK